MTFIVYRIVNINVNLRDYELFKFLPITEQKILEMLCFPDLLGGERQPGQVQSCSEEDEAQPGHRHRGRRRHQAETAKSHQHRRQRRCLRGGRAPGGSAHPGRRRTEAGRSVPLALARVLPPSPISLSLYVYGERVRQMDIYIDS